MKGFCFCLAFLLVLLTKSNGSGEIKDLDANSAEIKPVIEFAESMLDKSLNSIFVHKVGNVLKAQKQIVSGVKYYLSFEFKETTCMKNKPNNGECNTFTKTEICTAQVWSRPWLSEHKMQLVNFSCKPQ